MSEMNLFQDPVGNIPLEEDSKSVTGVQGSAIFNSQTDNRFECELVCTIGQMM